MNFYDLKSSNIVFIAPNRGFWGHVSGNFTIGKYAHMIPATLVLRLENHCRITAEEIVFQSLFCLFFHWQSEVIHK